MENNEIAAKRHKKRQNRLLLCAFCVFSRLFSFPFVSPMLRPYQYLRRKSSNWVAPARPAEHPAGERG